jgi:adenosylcobinamide-phosphate synthase
MVSPILPALLVDLLAGDPEKGPHPVRLIGSAIERLEVFLRARVRDETLAGALLFVIVVLSSFLASFAIWMWAARLHPFAGYAVNVAFIYWSISIKNLGDEALAVFKPLSEGDIESARFNLSRIVGRDTEELNETGIARACVETVSENFVDGVLSPLFFALIGGGPLAITYKAVNTCDSMVGYKNEKYLKLGKVSAIADDVANFIPARLSIPFIAMASFLLGIDYKNSFRIGMSDRLKHPSPNAAHSEAAFAGALGITLGGESVYRGEKSSKPVLGERLGEPERRHIPEAVRLMRVTSVIVAAIFISLSLGF